MEIEKQKTRRTRNMARVISIRTSHFNFNSENQYKCSVRQMCVVCVCGRLIRAYIFRLFGNGCCDGRHRFRNSLTMAIDSICRCKLVTQTPPPPHSPCNAIYKRTGNKGKANNQIRVESGKTSRERRESRKKSISNIWYSIGANRVLCIKPFEL